MKNIKFLHIIWALFYITIFFILLNNSYNYLDPDLGWHLRVGEQILTKREVPNLELYNYTLEGRAWVDHEWLINTFTYWVYNNFGYLTLSVFFALIIVISLLILNLLIQKYVLDKKNGFIFIVFFQTIGIIASLPHLGIRMQEITILNLIFLLLIIYHYNKNKKFKILFFLFPLFFFWASTHAGFLIGLFVLFIWLFVKLIENLLFRHNYFKIIDYKNKLTIKQIAIILPFFFGTIISTLITPYGLKLYQFLSDYQNTIYLKTLKEWFPFYAPPIQYWQLLYAAIVLLAVLLITTYSFLKKKGWKINLWDTSISIIFLLLALKSKRHFPLLFVVSFPMMINFFTNFFNPPENNFLNKKFPKQYFIIKPYIIISILLIIAARLIGTNFVSDPFISTNKFPRDGITFLKQHPEYDNLKLFNKYKWGGYLIWTYPKKKLFIDGRLSQFPYAEHTLLEEYLKFFRKKTVEEKLEKHNIDLVLLPQKQDYYKLNWFEKYFLLFNEEKINNRENHLKSYLENSSNWEIVFNNDLSIIYKKQ